MPAQNPADRTDEKLNSNEMSGIPAAVAQGVAEGGKNIQPQPDAMVDPRGAQSTAGINVGGDAEAPAKPN
ncbi:MAG TPA: hypothetical protein VF669_08425 [Tepidisphaeraceae bacterium]|jgi:hypothetical protein